LSKITDHPLLKLT